MGQRISGVGGNCLLEKIARLFDRTRRSLIEIVPALQIKLVGAGADFGNAYRAACTRPESAGSIQVLGDLARNLFLNGRDLGKLAAELRAPELGAVADIDQLRANHQTVVALQHAPGQSGPDAEILTDLLRIDLATLVAEHGAPRHYLESRQLRQVVDEALGQAVGEIVEILVPTEIFERQNRDRIHAALRSSLGRTWAGADSRRSERGCSPLSGDPTLSRAPSTCRATALRSEARSSAL